MKYLSLLGFCVLCVAVLVCCQTTSDRERTTPFVPGVHVVTLGVSDLQKSFSFYRDGLGFLTKMTSEGGIVLFTTSGAKLFLYPYGELARTSGVDFKAGQDKRAAFAGFTLGHAVLTREDVDRVLKRAADAGGKIVKPAHEVSWGAYIGYFSDPDGYLWEVANSDIWHFSPEGALVFPE